MCATTGTSVSTDGGDVSTDGGGVVCFENVGLRYGLGPEVLRDVSYTLEPGSFHFLTGPSGAGKSSLLRLMFLSHKPSRGLISVFGTDVSSASRETLIELRRQIGVVFQDFRLLNHLTARENVALPLKMARVREPDIAESVEELLSWIGLADRLDAFPETLSGGEKQRLAIARAVIRRPKLLLADEPTGNVDPDNSLRLMRLFEELYKIGTTVVFATHDEWLASQYTYARLRLDGGILAHTPGHRFAAR